MLRMHILGKPISRQWVPKTCLLGLAINHRPGGSELKAKTEIIDKAGYLALVPSYRRLACNNLGKRPSSCKVNTSTERPPLVVVLFRNCEPSSRDMDRLVIMAMQHKPIGATDCCKFDLSYLDRTDMHAGLDPVLEKYIVDRIGGAHGDVGSANRIFRLRDRYDLDVEQPAHLARKRRASLAIGAKAADAPDFADRADCHQLRASLPTRPQDADRTRVLTRQIFDAKSIGCANTDSLHDSVRHDRQWFAGLRREQ